MSVVDRETLISILLVVSTLTIGSAPAKSTVLAGIDRHAEVDRIEVRPDGRVAIDGAPSAANATLWPAQAAIDKMDLSSVVDSRWSEDFAVPLGCDGLVWDAVAAPTGEIFLGGEFFSCAGTSFNRVVRYDPKTDQWSALGSAQSNGVNGPVYSLILDGSVLYVGGAFSEALHGSSVAASNIAQFDLNTEQWAPLGSAGGEGVNNAVWALRTDDSHQLYVGGFFTEVNLGNTLTANHVAKWDPATGLWSTLAGPGGEGTSGAIFDIMIDDGAVLVAGQFGSVNLGNPVSATGIARWEVNSGWSAPFPGIAGIFAIAKTDTHLYAGGYFELVADGSGSTFSSPGIARWSFADGRWYSVDGGLDRGFQQLAQVRSLHLDQDRLYVGGQFVGTNGSAPIVAPNLLVWNLTQDQWETVDGVVGSGAAGFVFALTRTASKLVLTGGTGVVGGPTNSTRTSGVALWDTTTCQWEAIGQSEGQGVRGFRVNDLATLGDVVYAAGLFFDAGELAVNSLAAWDGETWSLVGSPENNGGAEIYRIVGHAGRLYVAGFFGDSSGPGAQPGMALVSWDPVDGQWRYLGSFADIEFDFGVVRAIHGRGDDVYVGGDFDTVETGDGAFPANNIARLNWRTGEWAALGTGVGDSESAGVAALHSVGDDLYVGGQFDVADPGGQGIAASHIARWDGSQWHALATPQGQGANRYVAALVADEHYLYVGGDFTMVGGAQQLPAERVARWSLSGEGWEVVGGGLGLPYDGTVDGVRALTIVDDVLYAGGNFRAVENGTVDVRYFARWNLAGGPWMGVGTGIEGYVPRVTAMTVGSGNDLYLAGPFFRAGWSSSMRLARYATRGTLTVSTFGTGAGQVTSSLGGLMCSGTCSTELPWDRQVALTARANASSRFLGWTGVCTGVGDCAFEFDQDAQIGAEFESLSDLFADDFEF